MLIQLRLLKLQSSTIRGMSVTRRIVPAFAKHYTDVSIKSLKCKPRLIITL